MRLRLPVKLLSGLVVCLLFVIGMHTDAFADVTAISPYSWDPGLYATVARYNNSVHAWGMRQTAGAWGTGPVNYQSGGTITNRASSSGTLRTTLSGTYCPNGACSYGSGSGYKGLVQFWNDPQNYIAFGLIHDPGVSPSGTTLMVEGAANGHPVGGYWAGGGISGTSHTFSFTWGASGISMTIDGQVTLGTYPVSMTQPSISFLSAARNTGDIVDTTFSGISFTSGSVVAAPIVIPSGTPYLTYTSTLAENGSGTGYSSYINSHDAYNNAISVGIQTDTSSPESQGQPFYIWELVQNGAFTYDYLNLADHNAHTVTLKWWQGSNTAVFYVDSTPLADIDAYLNPRLFFNAEGNARLNGDSVNSTVNNVQITVGNNCPTYCGLNGSWNTSSFNSFGLQATNTNSQPQNGANFSITGTVSGLPPGGNWDNNLVAGIGMIAQYWNGQ